MFISFIIIDILLNMNDNYYLKFYPCRQRIGRKIAEKINEQLASDAKIIFKKLGDKDANEFLRLMSLLAG